MIEKSKSGFFVEVAEILRHARQSVVRQVNSTMVITYFEIGRIIVEEEQNGKNRAEYGSLLLEGLSDHLTNEFGRGFSVDNLENMRRFYGSYQISETLSRISGKTQKEISQTASGVSEQSIPETLSRKLKSNEKEIPQTLSAELPKGQTPSRIFNLSWSHYLVLMRMDDQAERSFYEIESAENNWSVRELKRQTDSALYQRLSLSRDKEGVKKLSSEGQQLLTVKDTLKDPYILEFLELSRPSERVHKVFS